MWSRTEKSEKKKEIMLGWYWLPDLFAYIYDALVDGVVSLSKRTSSKPSASAENRKKKDSDDYGMYV